MFFGTFFDAHASDSQSAQYIVGESYKIIIPGEIYLSGSGSSLNGSASVSATDVALGARQRLVLSLNTTNGALKLSQNSSIPYTISIDNKNTKNASTLVGQAQEIFRIKSSETGHDSVSISFTVNDLANLRYAGIYSDTLVFSVKIEADLLTMQDLDKAEFDDGQQHQVVDERDGRVYWATKLADGNIWMTQNLDYRAGATYSGSDVYYAGGVATSGTSTAQLADDATEWHYAGGSYYNWNAAQNACPSGWSLPTKDQFSNLVSKQKLTNDSILASPFYGVRAGHYNNSSVGTIGSKIFLWSKTEYNSTSAYYLYADPFSTSVNQNSKSPGNSVRCIAN